MTEIDGVFSFPIASQKAFGPSAFVFFSTKKQKQR